jgi:hypothetical protein
MDGDTESPAEARVNLKGDAMLRGGMTKLRSYEYRGLPAQSQLLNAPLMRLEPFHSPMAACSTRIAASKRPARSRLEFRTVPGRRLSCASQGQLDCPFPPMNLSYEASMPPPDGRSLCPAACRTTPRTRADGASGDVRWCDRTGRSTRGILRCHTKCGRFYPSTTAGL